MFGGIEIVSEWYCSVCDIKLADKNERCPLCERDKLIVKLGEQLKIVTEERDHALEIITRITGVMSSVTVKRADYEQAT